MVNSFIVWQLSLLVPELFSNTPGKENVNNFILFLGFPFPFNSDLSTQFHYQSNAVPYHNLC